VRYTHFMRAKELIPILAEIYAVPFETAWVYDRSLADNGLRTKGKGRTPPDMTRRDAINFLLACMTATVATKAADDVKVWANAVWSRLPTTEYREVSNAEEARATSDLEMEELAAMGVEPGVEHIDDAPRSRPYPMGYKTYIADPLDGQDKVTFADYLLALTRFLDEGHLDPESVKIEIVSSHGHASVQYALYGEEHTDYFEPAERVGNPKADIASIYKISSVYGEALLAIAARTEAEN